MPKRPKPPGEKGEKGEKARNFHTYIYRVLKQVRVMTRPKYDVRCV